MMATEMTSERKISKSFQDKRFQAKGEAQSQKSAWFFGDPKSDDLNGLLALVIK